MSEERFTYTTDEEIGVPGFYRTNEDGSVDSSVRYKWVDDAPDDETDGSGHFEPHEHQYERAAKAKKTVDLSAQTKGSGKVSS